MKKRQIFIGFIIVFGLIVISASFYLYQVVRTSNFQVDKTDTYVYIEEDTSFEELLSELTDKKIVHDPLSFAFLSKLMDYQNNIKAGRYLIKKNMNNLEAIRMLRGGQQSPVKLTFNNIRTLDEFVESVSQKLMFSEKDLNKILKDSARVAKLGCDKATIIALFLPNTYEVYWNISAEDFVARMKKEYDKFWTKERLAKAKKLDFSPQEVSTLASIVDAETSKSDEKPRIAGTYLNRLEKGMRLQADPTVIFAVGDFSIKRVLNRHLKFDSPYNTYRNKGLPPGPIRMPSLSGIEAVLNPEKHSYLYFCAKEDFSGYHSFATTYAAHLKNAKLYQKALDLREKN